MDTPRTIPLGVLQTSPVGNQASFSQRRGAGPSIPLNILAMIISHVDDAADLARLTRASRLFYYMTLPKLYENVTLRSYAELRYINGRPEGYGGGSPFATGLQVLVTKPFASYVRSWRLVGELAERDNEEYIKGRIPDSSMLLNISIRAALDKMPALESFSWGLSTKPLNAIYQGLALRPSLKHLSLRFPTTRIPRPTVVIPAMPELRSLTAYDIDPLCHPDDISHLIARSLKLESLTLHWHPRMREMGEESISMMGYFARTAMAGRRLQLKRIAMYNLYARNTNHFEDVVDASTIEEITLLNSFGSDGDPRTVFLDETWKLMNHDRLPYNLKMMRVDHLDEHHVDMLSRITNLERLYLIKPRNRSSSTGSQSATETPVTPSPTASTPLNPQACSNLASEYLAVIRANHGSTLRHLLLSDRWMLGQETASQLLRSCPNLEQLGVALEDIGLEGLRRLMKDMPKVHALRLLVQPGSELAAKLAVEAALHERTLGLEFWREEYQNLEYFGIGDFIFQLLDVQVLGSSANSTKGTAAPGFVRRIRELSREDVEDVDIWGLDTLDLR